MSGQKRGVGVVVRVRPTAQYAHGALMVDTDRHTVDLKLDATHDDVVNNQVSVSHHIASSSLKRMPQMAEKKPPMTLSPQ